MRALLISFTLAGLAFGANCSPDSDPKLAAQLRDETKAWIAKIEHVSDEENGALIVMKGARALKDDEALFRDPKVDLSDAKVAAYLEAYLKANAEALETLDKGLAMEMFAYTTDYEKTITATPPDLIALRKAMTLYRLAGELSLSRGRSRDAVKVYLKAVRLGTSLTMGHPLLVTYIFSTAVTRTGLEGILRCLAAGGLRERHLRKGLAQLLETFKARQPLSGALDVEYHCFQIAGLALVAEGKAEMATNLKKDNAAIKQWHELFQKADPGRFFEAPAELREGGVAAKLGLGPNAGAVYASTSLPGLEKAFVKAARLEALWRGTLTAVAVSQVGAEEGCLPPDLKLVKKLVDDQAMTDPFTGKPLVYKPQSVGFDLYSAGPDQKDDGGDKASLVTRPDAAKNIGLDLVYVAAKKAGPPPWERGEEVKKTLLAIFDQVKKGAHTEAARHIVYRGDDKTRRWKDTCDYGAPKERAYVDRLCQRIRSILAQGEMVFKTFRTETEGEGTWLSWEVGVGGKKVIFALLEIDGRFAIGDID